MLAYLVFLALVAHAVAALSLLRVNAGGASFVNNATGEQWLSDAAAGATLTPSTAPIYDFTANASYFEDDPLAPMLSTELFSSADFVYSLPLAPRYLSAASNLTVRLYFSENYAFADGVRVFNVSINGVPCM